MRVFLLVPFICMVALLSCRFVKSINDTNIDGKSIEEPEDEETTVDADVTEMTGDNKAMEKMTRTADVTESSNANSTIENFTKKTKEKNPSNKISLMEETEDYWMRVRSSIDNELMDVQAILVKDEEVTKQCQTANLKAKTRYLMCGGSVISDHHVLTSASCLHEATHIRHNIKAPLAIVVAPVKSGSQIIRVQDYVIHPQHQSDPYGSNYLKHNLAILKLACRIKSQNLKKVKMPESPFTEICGDENCMVALFRKLGKSSYQMQEITAENIPLSKRKRDQNAVLQSSAGSSVRYESLIDVRRNNGKIRKLINPPRFGSRFVVIGSEAANRNWRKNLNDFDNTKKSNTQSEIVSTTVITEKNTREIEPMGRIDESIIDDNTVKSIIARASDGTSRCPRTGSPVMSNNVQAAVVSVPCDDRQPSRNWGYTDLFVNIDWIKEMVENWKKIEKLRSETINKGSCSTCIFNIYLSKDQDLTYENLRRSDCGDVMSIAKKDNLKNENVAQTVEIRLSNNDNNSPNGIYSNFAGTRVSALPTVGNALREYRSNTESIGQPSNYDNQRSIVNKCMNVTGNCTPEVDILGVRTNSKMTERKEESLTSETRDKMLLEKMKFFKLKNTEKSMGNQSQRDIHPNKQIYSHYFNNRPIVLPEALKTIFARSGGKIENQLPRIPFERTENRGTNHKSNTQQSKAPNVTLFNPNLRGLFKDPKNFLNYPEISENTNTDDSTEDHVIVVKLRIEEPRHDPSKTSKDIEEAILKNMSIIIDGDQSKNSEIYVNGKSLKNSEIYVYGERSHNSRNYRDTTNFRPSSRKLQTIKIDRPTNKSITWPKVPTVRFASSTSYERQSYVANNSSMETRNGNKGHPARRMEFANNVANLPNVRNQDLHASLRKNRQKGKD